MIIFRTLSRSFAFHLLLINLQVYTKLLFNNYEASCTESYNKYKYYDCLIFNVYTLEILKKMHTFNQTDKNIHRYTHDISIDRQTEISINDIAI